MDADELREALAAARQADNLIDEMPEDVKSTRLRQIAAVAISNLIQHLNGRI